MKNVTQFNDIRAKVTTSWNHPNCKFKPNQVVRVNKCAAVDHERKSIKDRVGQTGVVGAATVASNGKMRGYGRQHTRYYVQFPDGAILGFHSHYLTAVDEVGVLTHATKTMCCDVTGAEVEAGDSAMIQVIVTATKEDNVVTVRLPDGRLVDIDACWIQL